MRASMSRDRIAVVGPLAGSLGVLLGMSAMSLGLLGCGPAAPPAAPAKPAAGHTAHDGHGGHDDHGHAHPETLAEGVAELEAMWGRVREALKAGDRDTADDQVHAVGHLLEDFEGLLAKEKTEAQEAGKKATQEVFDCFDKLDEAFHGDEDDLKKLDLEALGQRLDSAIKTLKGLVTADAKELGSKTSGA